MKVQGFGSAISGCLSNVNDLTQRNLEPLQHDLVFGLVP